MLIWHTISRRVLIYTHSTGGIVKTDLDGAASGAWGVRGLCKSIEMQKQGSDMELSMSLCSWILVRSTAVARFSRNRW